VDAALTVEAPTDMRLWIAAVLARKSPDECNCSSVRSGKAPDHDSSRSKSTAYGRKVA
jgi:hypothetical protein